jgi:hypothetical protein
MTNRLTKRSITKSRIFQERYKVDYGIEYGVGFEDAEEEAYLIG